MIFSKHLKHSAINVFKAQQEYSLQRINKGLGSYMTVVSRHFLTVMSIY